MRFYKIEKICNGANEFCLSKQCKLTVSLEKVLNFCIDFVYTTCYIRNTDAVYFLNDEGFVWNENKAKSNKRKHGVSFEEAREVFFGPFRQVGECLRE
jgi:hypothetical protein